MAEGEHNMTVKDHFIAEWAARRGLSQADIGREINANKALVSRWFNQGIIPQADTREKLAGLFGISRNGLFMHPDDYVLATLFQRMTEDQKHTAVNILKAAFPDAFPPAPESARRLSIDATLEAFPPKEAEVLRDALKSMLEVRSRLRRK